MQHDLFILCGLVCLWKSNMQKLKNMKSRPKTPTKRNLLPNVQ